MLRCITNFGSGALAFEARDGRCGRYSERLEARLTRYVRQIAPLPLEQLRRLEQELLEKATQAQTRASA